jgi:hypothetical protein
MGAKEGRQGNTFQKFAGCQCHMTRQCPPPGDFNPTSERQKPAKSGPLNIFSMVAIADEMGGAGVSTPSRTPEVCERQGKNYNGLMTVRLPSACYTTWARFIRTCGGFIWTLPCYTDIHVG